MEKLEETQVCTSVEQSERLLKLGLNKETADMVYVTDNNVEKKYRYHRIKVGCYIPAEDDGLCYIPAWSLHRLIAMVADTPLQVGSQVGIHVEDTYDMVIQGIEWLISRGQFNKNYLEEKQ